MDHRSVAARYATAFTGAGLVIGLVIVLVMRVAVLVTGFPISIALGALATLVAARILGAALSTRTASASAAVAGLLGVVIAAISVEIGTLVGSLPQLFADVDTLRAFGFGKAIHDYVGKPMFWVSAFGLIPALILGSIYDLVLRSGVLFGGRALRAVQANRALQTAERIGCPSGSLSRSPLNATIVRPSPENPGGSQKLKRSRGRERTWHTARFSRSPACCSP